MPDWRRSANVSRLLVDTGPLVAWLDRRDQDHARVTAFLTEFRGRLSTTWPVLTEVCHLIPSHLVPRFLRWAAVAVEVHDLPATALADIAARIEKYRDLPMDLADASLVWLGERIGVTDILTLDERDFGVYRLAGGQRFRSVLASV